MDGSHSTGIDRPANAIFAGTGRHALAEAGRSRQVERHAGSKIDPQSDVDNG